MVAIRFSEAALGAAREWDDIMRALSSQFGVVHPFAEMVESLPLGEHEMQTLGCRTNHCTTVRISSHCRGRRGKIATTMPGSRLFW